MVWMKRLVAKVKGELAYYRALAAHPRTPRPSRWLIGLAILYLLSPLDLIPDGIPVLGQLDDLIVVPGLMFLAVSLIPPAVRVECRAGTRSAPVQAVRPARPS